MTPLLRLPTLVLILFQAVVHANPTEAERVKTSYKTDMAAWSRLVSTAATPEIRAQAWKTRPDPATYGRRMWTVIAPALGEEWAIEPMAWFIGLTINLQTTPAAPASGSTGIDGTLSNPVRQPATQVGPAFRKELDAISAAITTYHMANPKLAPVCLAYASGSDPRSLALLEKIESSHAAKTVQGVAALAIATRIRSLGDDPELMSKRLKLLRRAIIESADVEIQGVTVAKLAQDELYVIRNLTKGRVAPELVGVDSGSRPLKLSDYRGKVVVLLFWNSGVAEVVRLLESMNTLKQRYADKPVVVVGVNNDTVENLRSIQKTDEDLLDFPNFSDPRNELAIAYRVGTWPVIYVLDAERKIQYAGVPGSFLDATVAALLEPPKADQPGRPATGKP